MDAEYRRYLAAQSRRYMEHVAGIRSRVRSLEAQIAEAEETAAGVRGVDYTRDRISRQIAVDAVPQAVAKLDELGSRLADAAAEYADELEAAGAALMQVEPLLAELLTYRYMRGMRWAEVALRMGYDEDHVRKYLHEAALVSLHPHIPHIWRDPLYSAI